MAGDVLYGGACTNPIDRWVSGAAADKPTSEGVGREALGRNTVT
jgi:hypothetical protein